MSELGNIRPFEKKDREALIDIFRKNTPTYFAPEEESEFLDFLENQIEEYFVIELNGIVVGSGGINSYDDGQTVVISWGMIDPQYQGIGLGAQLLQFRIDRIVNVHRPERFLVRTAQFTYQFFEKYGFKVIRTEKDFWAKGIDLYEMEYDLKK